MDVSGAMSQERTYKIWTLAGPIVPVVRKDGLVTVDMGAPILKGRQAAGSSRRSLPREGGREQGGCRQ